jgi:hypothetical protein
MKTIKLTMQEINSIHEAEEEKTTPAADTAIELQDKEKSYHLKLGFEDFFQEEETTYTTPKVRKACGAVYQCTKFGCYNCLVIVFGVIFALIWGFVLSITSFFMNWMYTPILKIIMWIFDATLPVLQPLKDCLGSFIELFAPFCKRLG